MASLTITGWDDMITRLTKLSKKPYLDDVAKTAVNAAKDTVASSMRSSLSWAEGHRGKSKDRTTGAVSASVRNKERQNGGHARIRRSQSGGATVES